MRIERVLTQCAHQMEIAELRHRALHDDGTGLLRPTAFQQRLGEHFGAAERHHLDLALVLVDLDHFGSFNKRFDHTVGDRILARVSEAIRASLRAEDVAGRIGGDEFAVLLPYTKKVEAAHVARRLLEKIREASGTYPGADVEVDVSASLGFETFDGGDLESLESLRAHAEIALRAAKRSGGDRGVYYRTLRG
jgi:diguanylate cyclase (GGDEF)-like protein